MASFVRCHNRAAVCDADGVLVVRASSVIFESLKGL
jgi:hypothetical protein